MDSKKCNCAAYGPTVLRGVIGLFFVLAGLNKLMNPAMIIGMLGKIGFPAASLFGWILILSELLFGGLILAGWNLKYSVWPLIVILVVATFATVIPTFGSNSMAMSSLFFHLTTLAGLVSLYLTGPGKLSVKQ